MLSSPANSKTTCALLQETPNFLPVRWTHPKSSSTPANPSPASAKKTSNSTTAFGSKASPTPSPTCSVPPRQQPRSSAAKSTKPFSQPLVTIDGTPLSPEKSSPSSTSKEHIIPRTSSKASTTPVGRTQRRRIIRSRTSLKWQLGQSSPSKRIIRRSG